MNITIIEDDPVYVKHAMDQLGVHALHFISTTQDAIEYFQSIARGTIPKPDVLFSDCMLPTQPDARRVAVIQDMTTLFPKYLEELETKGETFRAELLTKAENDLVLNDTESTIGEMQKEIDHLKRTLYHHCPHGYNFVLEAILLGIPFIGLLKGTAHSNPPIAWSGWQLFDQGDKNSSYTQEGFRKNSQKAKVGTSCVVMGEVGYTDISDEQSMKRWDLLLDDLIKLRV